MRIRPLWVSSVHTGKALHCVFEQTSSDTEDVASMHQSRNSGTFGLLVIHFTHEAD